MTSETWVNETGEEVHMNLEKKKYTGGSSDAGLSMTAKKPGLFRSQS